MASATRRRNHRYVGAPWPRGTGSQKAGKMERTKQSKAPPAEGDRRPFVLPLVVRPDGRWGYKFGRMRKALKKGRL